MKTTLVTTSILASLVALAAPVAAECTTLDATGATVCANADGASSFSASAVQPGAGGAFASRGEFSMFGTTFRETHATVHTEDSPAGHHSVSVTDFCIERGGECTLQERIVTAYTPATGFVTVSLLEQGGARTLCVTSGEQVCQEL